MGTSCRASVKCCPLAIEGAADTQNLTAGGTHPSEPPSALSLLFEISQGEGDKMAVGRKDHQCVLGYVALARSEEYLKLQSVQRIPAVSKDEGDTIFNEYFWQNNLSTPTHSQRILQRLQKRRRVGFLAGPLLVPSYLDG